MKRDVVIIVVGLALLSIVWVGWNTFQEIRPDSNEKIFCTADAKLCPDGSYVGRIPPNCEFARCPRR